MNRAVALVTGFEPYGGRAINPSAEIVRRLDGAEVAGVPVVGRLLPVSFATLRQRARDLLSQFDPVLILSLGLWPGEPAVRLERVALNLAHFEIPDNDGALVANAPVEPGGPLALPSRLPLDAILQALLDAGIPARLSSSAGNFLCNATMYTFLRESQRPGTCVPCGFVHLPYLPEQVADLLRQLRDSHAVELHQRADLSSMSLETMLRAARIIAQAALGHQPDPSGT